jgi:hypothetical protein
LKQALLAYCTYHLMTAGLGLAGLVSQVLIHGGLVLLVSRLAMRKVVARSKNLRPLATGPRHELATSP